VAALPVTETDSAPTAAAQGAAGGAARRLSAAELDAYRSDGFVVVPRVFPADELERIDQEIDRLLPEYGDRTGYRQGWILGFGVRSDVTRAVAEDERILSLIEDIVHPGIAIHSAKLVAKLPHSDDVCHWHQDEAFYLKPDDPLTHSQTRMSVWVPLQDAHQRNGCLWVVPGSHTWGLEPFVTVDYGTCRRKLTKEEYANQHAIPVPVSAGSVVLFSAWTWHHSKNNQTDHVRRAFIVSYQEATVGRGAANGLDWRILRAAPAA